MKVKNIIGGYDAPDGNEVELKIIFEDNTVLSGEMIKEMLIGQNYATVQPR